MHAGDANIAALVDPRKASYFVHQLYYPYIARHSSFPPCFLMSYSHNLLTLNQNLPSYNVGSQRTPLQSSASVACFLVDQLFCQVSRPLSQSKGTEMVEKQPTPRQPALSLAAPTGRKHSDVMGKKNKEQGTVIICNYVVAFCLQDVFLTCKTGLVRFDVNSWHWSLPTAHEPHKKAQRTAQGVATC